MNFNPGTNAFGFASVTVPCSNNQAYALSNGTSTTKIYAIDMIAKTEATTATCTLNYNVYDAASIAETSTSTAPNAPSVTSPIGFCLGQTITPLTVSYNVPDTLRWYKQLTGGTIYGSPTPALSSTNVGSTKYYVSNFDTSTGCESDRSLIEVIVNPYPNVPTIIPIGTNTICVSDSIKLTSSATANHQWFLNGNPIIGATNQIYFAKLAGNYTVLTTGVGGCSKTSIATAVNVINASISYVGNPFCKTGSATVTQTGSVGGSYSSTPAGLSIDMNTGTINLTASAIGTYTIIYTVGSANCKFTTSVSVQRPTASFNYSSTQYCKANTPQSPIFSTGSVTGGAFSATPFGLNIDMATGVISPSSSNKGNYTITYTYGNAASVCGLQTTTTDINIVDTTTSLITKSICNGDSVLFNGTYYKTAGTYNFNTTNVFGCDSVATLILSVNPKLNSSITKSICNGDSILFNGTYYKAAGTYNFNTTNIFGCDSVATLILSVNPKLNSSITKSICNGDSILFNGTYYKTAGTYNFNTTNVFGCDSVATLILSVNPKLNSSITKSICNGDSILFNGTYFKTAGTYNFNTTNVFGCDSVATLNLILKATTTSISNATICNGDSILFNGTYYKLQGKYNVNLTNSIGCDSIATLNLNVENFKLTLKTLPNNINANTTLNASITASAGIASSIWQPSSLFLNNVSSQTITTPTSSFTIKIKAFSTNGCIDSVENYITINPASDIIFIPNAFIPFDAKNVEDKTLKVYGSFIKNAVLEIYNQWGQKVAILPNANTIGWDGTVNGKRQSSGVYVYIAKIILSNNKEIIKQGTVNLVR
jgi:hypothetical protein